VDRYRGLVNKIQVMEGRYERGMGREMLGQAANILKESIPLVVSSVEAEEECARMCRANRVKYCVTEDIDALSFGAPIVLRGATGPAPEVIVLETVLSELRLTDRQFIDMCILSGCDFTPKPPGYGPATSLKDILKHKSLSAMLGDPLCFPKWSRETREEIEASYPDAFAKFFANWAAE